MSDIENKLKELTSLIAKENAPYTKSKDLLNHLKGALIEFTTLHSLTGQSDKQAKELLIAREIMENAVLLSVKLQDGSLDKHFTQLRCLYDSSAHLGQSGSRSHIYGIYLMHLLVETRLSDFHSELELLSNSDRSNNFIQFPVQLEQKVMEGAYSKVIALSHHQPSPYYAHFMESLINTIRGDIAECSEKSYPSLSLSEAQKMLMMNSRDQLVAYVKSREENGWSVEGDKVVFHATQVKDTSIPTMKLIQQTLEYASEIERII